jgi:hypothetical protein
VHAFVAVALCTACGGRVRVDGSRPTAVATSDSIPSLAIDADHVYWTAFTSDGYATAGYVWSAPLTGGAPLRLADAQVEGYAIAIDRTSAYWDVERRRQRRHHRPRSAWRRHRTDAGAGDELHWVVRH